MDAPVKVSRHGLTAPIAVFDIGGTFIRGGAYDPDLMQISAPIVVRDVGPEIHSLGRGAAFEILCNLLAEVTESVWGDSTPTRIALAFPGPISRDGRVLAAPTLAPSLAGIESREFERVWPTAPVFLMNDVTAAGFECVRRGHPDFLMVNVGSGIGTKIFIDGRPRTGPRGRGGELGHFRVDFSADAPRCDCGGFGHLGALASGRGAVNTARRMARAGPRAFQESWIGTSDITIESISTYDLVEAYARGDRWASSVIREVAGQIANMVCHTHLAIGVETIFLTGGFAGALGARFVREVAEESARRSWGLGQDWSEMIRLEVDTNATLRGAGFAVQRLEVPSCA
jgi:predicted NBD/HSP70 family sugar kinase